MIPSKEDFVPVFKTNTDFVEYYDLLERRGFNTDYLKNNFIYPLSHIQRYRLNFSESMDTIGSYVGMSVGKNYQDYTYSYLHEYYSWYHLEILAQSIYIEGRTERVYYINNLLKELFGECYTLVATMGGYFYKLSWPLIRRSEFSKNILTLLNSVVNDYPKMISLDEKDRLYFAFINRKLCIVDKDMNIQHIEYIKPVFEGISYYDEIWRAYFYDVNGKQTQVFSYYLSKHEPSDRMLPYRIYKIVEIW